MLKSKALDWLGTTGLICGALAGLAWWLHFNWTGAVFAGLGIVSIIAILVDVSVQTYVLIKNWNDEE